MGESIEWLLRISINIQVYLPIKKNYRSILSLEKLLVNHRLKGVEDRLVNAPKNGYSLHRSTMVTIYLLVDKMCFHSTYFLELVNLTLIKTNVLDFFHIPSIK